MRQPNEATDREKDDGIAWSVQEQQGDRCDWNDKRNDQILDTFQSYRPNDRLIGRYRFNVGFERKEDIRDYTKVLGLSSWKNGVNHLLMEKIERGGKKRSLALDTLRCRWVLEMEVKVFSR